MKSLLIIIYLLVASCSTQKHQGIEIPFKRGGITFTSENIDSFDLRHTGITIDTITLFLNLKGDLLKHTH